ncbi:hypothetical protein RVY52_002523 [Burkholderia cenocepacia]|nr:hypothetical protein [Burkholderia cenocepacia]
MQELTDEQILTVARHHFRDGHTADPSKLHAYCDTVRTVIACYNLEPVTQAARDVLAERRRQVEVEGFTPEHDDAHSPRELAAAAGSYALHAHDQRIAVTPAWWPWARAWWKPGTPRRMLVKAGALILAAIERIDREPSAMDMLG